MLIIVALTIWMQWVYSVFDTSEQNKGSFP